MLKKTFEQCYESFSGALFKTVLHCRMCGLVASELQYLCSLWIRTPAWPIRMKEDSPVIWERSGLDWKHDKKYDVVI